MHYVIIQTLRDVVVSRNKAFVMVFVFDEHCIFTTDNCLRK